jgi:hypothetical protein
MMTTGYERVPEHLQKYVDYINNAGQTPLSEAAFDDDWEPIGPKVRSDLRLGGFIYMGGETLLSYDCKPGIYLRPDLVTSSLRLNHD